jgi:hypothetical protein
MTKNMNWINEAVAAFIKTIEKAEAEAEAEARAEAGIEDGEERDMSDQGNWTDEEFEAYWEAQQEAEKHDNFATRYELNIEEIMAERRQIENKQRFLATLATECGRPLTRREKSHALTALALGMV